VLGRDALLILGLAVIHFMAGKAVVRPRFTGKLATVLQMATILWTLLRWNPGVLAWLTAAAALFTGISGLYYIFDGVRQLAAHPSSNPSHG